MDTNFRTVIKCHVNDRGESWAVQVWRADDLIAAAGQLPSAAAARAAGEFLIAGALNDWSLKLHADVDMAAGLGPLQAPDDELVDDPDRSSVALARVAAIVEAVWVAGGRRMRAEGAEGHS